MSGLFGAQRFKRALRRFVLGRAAQAALTLLLALVVIRLLPPLDYGLYMIIWGAVEFAIPITSLGLLPVVQRFLPELAEHGSIAKIRQFLNQVKLIRWTTTLAFCLLAYWQWAPLSHWIGADTVPGNTTWLVVALIGAVIMGRFTAEMLECLLEQGDAQLVRALYPLWRVLGLAGLWWLDRVDLTAILWLELTGGVLVWWLAEFFLWRRLRALQPQGQSQVNGREMLRYGLSLSWVQLCAALGSYGVVRVVVARLLGLEAAGVFAFLQQLVVIAQRYMPSVLLANMVRPMLISAVLNGRAQQSALVVGALWKSNILLLAPGVALFVVAGDALLVWASGQRVVGAGTVMAVMMLGVVATAQEQILAMAMHVHRYTRMVRSLGTVALLIPPAAWLGAHWGLLGVVAGVTVAVWLRAVLAFWALRRSPSGLAVDWRGVLGPVLSLLVLAALARWASEMLWRGHGVALLWAAFMLALYLVTWVIYKVISPQERDFIAQHAPAGMAWVRHLAR